jgi:aminopeptidase N
VRLRLARVAALAFVMIAAASCGEPPAAPDPEPGIDVALAHQRATSLHDVRYDLTFDIPLAPADPIHGRAVVRFTRSRDAGPLMLDFAPGQDAIRSIAVNGGRSRARAVNGHIVVPARELREGDNTIDLAFRAGDAPLNRTADFLYSLFVPARAHLTFPCFDQPDIKARFTLTLSVPGTWEALGNGAELARDAEGDRLRIRYAPTEPIPTYLFAFAAGAFSVETTERDGRTFRMLHRETDAAKVERNRDRVFDLHAAALTWLQDYTRRDYAFGKFDFLLVPSFQFGGMEHPGAIFYNAASILLDESATESQHLGRASLIAHETAHMWFGDLVTMRWFDDVWMKEVFANVMAAKIVNPAFPGVNHDLRFLTAHYPAAYAVDRTAGTHPIRQELTNLNEAGSLYGAIIYQKAPIVMRQLERLMGADVFRDGLREYLQRFAFGNATWLDLIAILDARTDHDLVSWSRAWVEEGGRPTIAVDMEGGRAETLVVRQSDSRRDRGLRWTQQIELVAGTRGATRTLPLTLDRERVQITDARALGRLDFVLPTGGGLAYGDVVLDDRSRSNLIAEISRLTDPLTRGAAWVALWEEMVGGRLPPGSFVDATLTALPRETVEQNVQLVTGYLGEAFWRFLSDSERAGRSEAIERTLRAGLARASSSSLKSTYFSALRQVITTPTGVAFLERVWRREETIPGLTLAEADEVRMALDLAVRGIPSAASVLDEERARIQNPDRKARFEFVLPAVSAHVATRDAFVASLAHVENRRREAWVVEGVSYVHHPLRATSAERHIRPALDLLVEIHRTGDIFFPHNWLDATLRGHTSANAAAIVRTFLNEHQDLPPRLRRLVLQSADTLFRLWPAATPTAPSP